MRDRARMALKNDPNKEWYVKKGDFFPLHEFNENSYWTGYYTTYPKFKLFCRESSIKTKLCFDSLKYFIIKNYERFELFKIINNKN